MLDTLIVFGLLGAIALLVVYVLPGKDRSNPAGGEPSIFPE